MKKLLSLVAIALLATPSLSKAGVQDRLYDFTDAYYLQNGINPTAIDGRRQPGPLAATDTPNFPFQRNVRALLTLPNYDASGNEFFFTVLGGFSINGFTGNAAGQRARQIADSFIEYVSRGKAPIRWGSAPLRQSVMLDMRNGYFSNDPLGLWTHVWVSYTSAALNTADGQKTLNDIAGKTGRDLDGTPIIANASDLDNLFKKGYVTNARGR